MRLLDANILMYASFDVFPQHARTKKWLDARLNDTDTPLGIPWESIMAFVRLSSNPRIMQPAISVATVRHRHYLDTFLNLPEMNHKLVADAHLAALAIEHGLVMVSADSDFRLFPGLRIEDPTI